MLNNYVNKTGIIQYQNLYQLHSTATYVLEETIFSMYCLILTLLSSRKVVYFKYWILVYF